MRSFGSGTPLAGRYVLVDQLAVGPDATVWRGLDDVLGRPVAVKMFTSAAYSAQDRAWIHQRARTAARLSHPHAAAVYDCGDAPGLGGAPVPYVVLELLDGVPLAVRLANGPLPWPLAVRTAAEVAAALAAAHARGVVHGDVGPDTVLLTDVGAKLIGFAGPTRAPRVELTPSDDVRALGVLLGLTVLGTEPHAGTAPEAFDRIADLPMDVPVVCLACLALHAGDRPSAEQAARRLAAVANQFAAAVEGGGERLLVPAVPARRAGPRPRRTWSQAHTGLAAAGVLVLLAFFGLVGGVGEDLISAATGHSRVDRDTRVNAPARPGPGPAATGPGGSPGATPGASGAATPLPSSPAPSGSATPSAVPSAPPTGTPTAGDALARLRTARDHCKSDGISPSVAAALDEQVTDVEQRAPGSVDQLKRSVNSWADSGGITRDCEIELLSALRGVEDTQARPGGK